MAEINENHKSKREKLEKFQCILLEDKVNCRSRFSPQDIQKISKYYDKLGTAVIYNRLDEIEVLRNDKQFLWDTMSILQAINCLDYSTANKILLYACSDVGDNRQITIDKIKTYFDKIRSMEMLHPILYEWIWKNIPHVSNYSNSVFRFTTEQLFKYDYPYIHATFLKYALAANYKETMQCSEDTFQIYWFFLDYYHPLNRWTTESLNFESCHCVTIPKASLIYFYGNRSLLNYIGVHLIPEVCDIVRGYLFLWDMLGSITEKQDDDKTR